MAIHGKVAQFQSHTSPTSIHTSNITLASINNLATLWAPSGSATLLAKKYMDSAANVTVYIVTGAASAATNTDAYSVEWSGARFHFENDPGVNTVTADYSYFAMSDIGGGFSWSLSVDGGLVEAPEFGDEWNYRVSGLRNWEISCDRYFVNDGFASVFNHDEIHVKAFIDESVSSGTQYYEGRGYLGGTDINAPVEELVEQSMAISGHGTLHYRS